MKPTTPTPSVPVVGIDLGTTNSAVACLQGRTPTIIASPSGEEIIPSVVHIDTLGRVIVGKDALASKVAMPSRTASAVKRQMGSQEPIRIADELKQPEEISALILKELKTYVDNHYGKGEKEAIVTVPAYFTDEQRRATKRAGELAGFTVERIINEPTAAALAFGLGRSHQNAHVLIYDLGGGTFDVSVVEMFDGVIEVKASTGNNRLGGEDFDWLLVDWLAQQIIDQHQVDPREDLRAKALLKEHAESIKKQLSSAEQAGLSLPLVCFKDQEPIGLEVEISREVFASMLIDMLDQTMELTRQAITEAKLQPKDIDEILLVGGSTRIPRVREMISAFFGKPPRTDVDPDKAVALGAAVQAGLKSGMLSPDTLVVTDVAPFSLGISVLHQTGHTFLPGRFSVIIPRNTTIPATKTERYHTTYPGQDTVSIEIFQGEHDWVKHNHRLDQFQFTGIPSNDTAAEEIDVTFHYNLNGILEVTAKSVSSGHSMDVQVHDQLTRDSEQAFDESVKRVQDITNRVEAEDPDIDSDLDSEFSFDGVRIADLEIQVGDALEQATAFLESIPSRKATKLRRLVKGVKKALSARNPLDVQAALDKLTDYLIDLELEEE